jgi:hypothetical protein
LAIRAHVVGALAGRQTKQLTEVAACPAVITGFICVNDSRQPAPRFCGGLGSQHRLLTTKPRAYRPPAETFVTRKRTSHGHLGNAAAHQVIKVLSPFSYVTQQ